MGYAVRVTLAFALAIAALVVGCWAVYHLARTGTCASGGPYQIARECPEGTGLKITLIFPSVVALLVAGGLWSSRGAQESSSPIGFGTLLWSLGFVGLAAAGLLAVFGPNAPDELPEAKLGIGIMAAIFIPMGLAPLLLARGAGSRQAAARRLLSSGRRAPGRVLGVEDTGATINDNPRVKVRVRAEPPGEAAFEIEKTAVVSRLKIPREGDPVAVFYDPSNPKRTGISLDSSALAMVGIDPRGADAGAPASAESPQPAGGDDAGIEQLSKLGELHRTGVLTDAEFAEQKARILRDL